MIDDVDASTVLHVFGAVVLLAAVLPFIVFAVPGVVGADASHVVLSGSMEPDISPGDVIIVTDVDPADIREGDVITFHTQNEDIPTTHRVVEVIDEGQEPAFLTKGDANEDPDATPVAAGNVQGKRMLTIPYIGHVIAFASEPLGAFLLMGLPLGLLLLTEIWSFAFGGSLIPGRKEGSSDDDRDAPADGGGGGSQSREDIDRERLRVPVEESSSTSQADTEETFTVTRADLQMTLLVTGAFAAYAGWIFYQSWIVTGQRTPLPITVVIATAASFLMLLAIYYGNSGDSPDSGRSDTSDEISTHPPAVESHTFGRGRSVDRDSVRIESVRELVETSLSTRTPIEWRPWQDTFYIARPSKMYLYTSNGDEPDERLVTQVISEGIVHEGNESSPAAEPSGGVDDD